MNVPLREFALRPRQIRELENGDFQIVDIVGMKRADMPNLRVLVRGVVQNKSMEISKMNQLYEKVKFAAKKSSRNFNEKNFRTQFDDLFNIVQLKAEFDELKKYMDIVEKYTVEIIKELKEKEKSL